MKRQREDSEQRLKKKKKKKQNKQKAVKRWRVVPRTLCKQADLTASERRPARRPDSQTAAEKKQKKDTKMSRSGWAACLLAC